MSLIRWNPTRDLVSFPSEISNLQREMNRMFDSFFRSGADEPGLLNGNWMPPVDVVEEENEYIVKVELPGVNKDDVKITLESNILTIRGEKKDEKEIKEKNYHRMERSYGSFQRSFTLPTTVKNDKIDASYKDGVLVVTLPKAEESKPKQIEVKVK
jgi:HSP20 family protein